MLKLKDFLLVLVVGYSVYQVYWGTGWNEQNLFLLICSLIAFGYSVLQKMGVFAKLKQRQEKILAQKKQENEE
ncbi:MAG: RNA helicase [Dialister sp.]|nr:RNA helicase [Dialister sp.]